MACHQRCGGHLTCNLLPAYSKHTLFTHLISHYKPLVRFLAYHTTYVWFLASIYPLDGMMYSLKVALYNRILKNLSWKYYLLSQVYSEIR